jgi:hypothetical protein
VFYDLTSTYFEGQSRRNCGGWTTLSFPPHALLWEEQGTCGACLVAIFYAMQKLALMLPLNPVFLVTSAFLFIMAIQELQEQTVVASLRALEELSAGGTPFNVPPCPASSSNWCMRRGRPSNSTTRWMPGIDLQPASWNGGGTESWKRSRQSSKGSAMGRQIAVREPAEDCRQARSRRLTAIRRRSSPCRGGFRAIGGSTGVVCFRYRLRREFATNRSPA